MNEATHLWERWQALLRPFATVFTRPGWVRFVQWVTGMVLCWEEHTITQILTALGLEARWRVLEHFAEYGAWDRDAVERQTLRLIEQERPARWGRYHPVALDDTKLHRTSAKVWGTCTFHEASARSPNRAETVRAHNWVVMGDLVAGTPWRYLPHAARLYCRKNQLPAGENFRTKTTLAVELLRQADAESAAPILGVFDGAYAVDTVVAPCLHPHAGQRRIEILTRLRADARLYHAAVPKPRAKGRRPLWGPRLAAPQHHLYWSTAWQKSRAWVYGRVRRFQYKQLQCRWSVSGAHIPVHVLVVVVDGYEKPWFLVTAALDLSAAQVVEAFTARFRQEDGFRDHKQRLGMEECRAWTKEPVLRTFQVQLLALTLLRLLQFRLDQTWGAESWWSKPEWYAQKRHASIRDLCRLFWRHRAVFSQLLIDLEDMHKTPQAIASQGTSDSRAA
jgi:hypothetical protein